MKKIYTTGIILLLTLLTLNVSPIHADTYVGEKSGSGRYGKHELLYYTTYTTKTTPMSDWHYFPNGGSLSRSDTFSKTSTFSASKTVGANWGVGSIESKLSVSYSTSRTVGTSATFIVRKKKNARIITKYFRRKVTVKKYAYDYAYLSSSISYPARSDSTITIEEKNL